MEVLIVSKTNMRKAVCVGAVTQNGQYLRLLDNFADNQPLNTPFNIGQIWDIKFQNRIDIIAPHIEDVLVTSQKYIKQVNISNIYSILQKLNIQIWHGNPTNLFNNCLHWHTWQGDTHQVLKGYINQECIPQNSVGFWLPDKDLYLKDGRYKYYNDNKIFSIKYVGVAEAIEKISRNTLCRVSLARWWDINGQTEDRCYLQLSGIYISE